MSGLRGALIVIEGCDRVGKSTQCQKLVKQLASNGYKIECLRFPDRTTETGKLIDSFLLNTKDFADEAIHLLFTANRWESKKQMEQKLNAGITLIVDRYSYSGIAYTAAKGLNLEWCKNAESRLLKPDKVIYLTLSPESMAKRCGFGNERYEMPEFQKKVYEQYENLYDEKYWTTVDADKTVDDLTNALENITINTIEQSKTKPLTLLW